MSIFNLFGGGNTSTPAAPATPDPSKPANPGNAPDTPSPTAVDDVSKGAPATETASDKPASPLDQYKDIWEAKPNDNSKAQPMVIDPAKVAEVMKNADFSSAMSQDNLAKIAAGGEDAVQAFASTINEVARQVMTQSTLVTNKMIEQQVAQAMEASQAQIPGLVKKQTLAANLSQSNPVFANPAVKPVIEAIQTQLSNKYPDASAAELTDMAQQFVTTMAESLLPQQTTTPQQGAADGMDWEKFLTQ